MPGPELTPDTRHGIEALISQAKALNVLQISIIVGEVRVDAVFDTAAPMRAKDISEEDLY